MQGYFKLGANRHASKFVMLLLIGDLSFVILSVTPSDYQISNVITKSYRNRDLQLCIKKKCFAFWNLVLLWTGLHLEPTFDVMG